MKQIYIADDDFDIINSIGIWLKRRNYLVRGFLNAELLYKGLEMQLPDLILLDVQLGAEDGRKICKDIKMRYEEKIPVILFSMVHDSVKDMEESHADDFIPKNVSLQELTALLQKHMQLEH